VRGSRLVILLLEYSKMLALLSPLYLALGADPPLPALTLVFVASFALASAERRSAGRGRGYALALFFGAGLALVAVLGLYRDAFDAPARFIPQSGGDWLVSAFVLVSTLGIWLRGAWLGRREGDRAFLVARVDEGIGFFLAALFFLALVRVEAPLLESLSLPFLLLALIALGLSRAAFMKTREGAFRRRRPLFLSFSALLGLAVLAISLLAPLLAARAEQARRGLGRASKGFLDWLGPLLDRLFVFQARPAPAVSTLVPNFAVPSEDAASQGGPLVDLLLLALGLLAGLALLLSLLLLAARLLGALSSDPRNKKKGGISFPPAWLRAILAFASRLLSRHGPPPRTSPAPRSAAKAAYARLLASGRFARLGRQPTETPREYARRLGEELPARAAEAEFLVDALEKECYGGLVLDPGVTARLRTIRRRTHALPLAMERLLRRRPAELHRRNC
jgi:hypothetical protein